MFTNFQPLNIEPVELPIIRANTERNLAFRPRLISRLRRQQAQRAAYERRFSEAYARHYQEWLLNVEQQSGSKRRRALDRKLRLEFGRTFKVLGKGRGQGDQGQGHHNLDSNGLKRVIQGAAILPDILYGKLAPPRFDNRNGLLADPLQVLRQSALRSPVILWTAEEKAIFRQMNLQKPKNFGYIAACLDGNKSVADCVAYYYASKRKEKYKEQVLANLRELSKKKMMKKKKSTSKQRKRK